MNRTKIEWVRSPDGSRGFTWNPITGCLNGCPYCYARRLANGRLKKRYLANRIIAPARKGYTGSKPFDELMFDPFAPRFWENRLDDLRTWTPAYLMSPRGIFVCDMGELFGGWIPHEWQERIFEVIRTCPQHRFYLLTKQPQNLIEFSPFPENCWVGFTATTDAQLQHGLAHIANIEAKIKFISFEPLLEPMSFLAAEMIDWVVIGSQTKPYKPPEKIWIDEITEACKKASIPYFLKDNLRPLLGDDLVQDMVDSSMGCERKGM